MPNKTPYIGAAGRLLIAVLFVLSGLGKIAAPAVTQGYIASAGLPFPLLALLIAIVYRGRRRNSTDPRLSEPDRRKCNGGFHGRGGTRFSPQLC